VTERKVAETRSLKELDSEKRSSIFTFFAEECHPSPSSRSTRRLFSSSKGSSRVSDALTFPLLSEKGGELCLLVIRSASESLKAVVPRDSGEAFARSLSVPELRMRLFFKVTAVSLDNNRARLMFYNGMNV
jgi:hypothetical protein